MKFNITKNFIIAFFVILAVYQTSELWFEDFSNHNFFYSFFYNSYDYDDDGLLYSLDSIIVNQSSDRFICLKNGIYKNDYKEIFDDAVRITLKKGNLLSSSSFDWNSFLSVRSVVYQYSCGIDPESIADMFGVEKSLLSNFSEKIDTIVIVPFTNSAPENLTVALGRRSSGKAYLFSLEKNQYVYTIFETIGSISPSSNIYYTSSVKNGLDLFKGNLFLPQWNGTEFSYYPIKSENPFFVKGEFEQIKLETAIDVFFDNPVSKWSSFLNNVYTYSDENTVIKYYPNSVMEYYNYSNEKNSSVNDFYSQYKSAVALLKKDTSIKNQFFFKCYSADNEKTIFYFDYKINDFSIGLSDSVKSAIGMDSFIEVTVSEGRVSKYRRFIRNFYIDDSQLFSVKNSFLKAVDDVFADFQTKGQKRPGGIESMELGYIFNQSDICYLCWFIDIDGKVHIKQT